MFLINLISNKLWYKFNYKKFNKGNIESLNFDVNN